MGEDREWRGERQKTVKRGDDRRNGEKLERGGRERKENEDETQKGVKRERPSG